MTTDSMTTVDDAKLFLGEAWSDPIEAGIGIGSGASSNN